MQHLEAGARSISLLIDLNFDRLVFVGTLIVALMAGAYMGSH
ncbi:hypothetical protein [Oceaniglobus roseus]|nr:hypothetical protein [Kandeliimicrobium roseum]